MGLLINTESRAARFYTLGLLALGVVVTGG